MHVFVKYSRFFIDVTFKHVLIFLYIDRRTYVQVPNTVGFIFGIVQMALYVVYKNASKVLGEPKLHHVPEHIIDAVKLTTIVCSELNPAIPLSNIIVDDNYAIGDQIDHHGKEKAQGTGQKDNMINESIKLV